MANAFLGALHNIHLLNDQGRKKYASDRFTSTWQLIDVLGYGNRLKIANDGQRTSRVKVDMKPVCTSLHAKPYAFFSITEVRNKKMII